MRSVVRKGSAKGPKDYTKKVVNQPGFEDPADDELRHFDRHRPGKKVSIDDWENPNDPVATITRMKDGTTRMAYKAEHAVDLDTDIVVAAMVHPGNVPDTPTIIDTAIDAAVNAGQAGVNSDLQAIVADKGYHSTKVVVLAADPDACPHPGAVFAGPETLDGHGSSGAAGGLQRVKLHAE